MRWHFKTITTVFIGILFQTSAYAGDIYVIVPKGSPVGSGDIKEIYTGNTESKGGQKLVPFSNTSGTAKQDFLEKYHIGSPAKFNEIWTKKSFRDGASRPEEKDSDAKVIEAVKNNPGGVGYVTSAPSDSGVTVIDKQ